MAKVHSQVERSIPGRVRGLKRFNIRMPRANELVQINSDSREKIPSIYSKSVLIPLKRVKCKKEVNWIKVDWTRRNNWRQRNGLWKIITQLRTSLRFYFIIDLFRVSLNHDRNFRSKNWQIKLNQLCPKINFKWNKNYIQSISTHVSINKSKIWRLVESILYITSGERHMQSFKNIQVYPPYHPDESSCSFIIQKGTWAKYLSKWLLPLVLVACTYSRSLNAHHAI